MRVSNLIGGVILLFLLYGLSIPSIDVNILGFPVAFPNPFHALWDAGLPLFIVPYSIPVPYILFGLVIICFVTAFRDSAPKMMFPRGATV